MKTSGLLMMLSLFGAGCAPRDVIPSAPTHPANPAAPAAGPPETTPDAAAAPTPATPPAPGAAPASDDTSGIAAAEKVAYERARPVFETYCAGCHSSAGTKKAKKKALPHFSIDSYPFGGHHAAEVGESVREVLGVAGEKPSMPADRPGAVKGAELDAIVEWSKAFDRAHAAGLHDHDGHQGHH